MNIAELLRDGAAASRMLGEVQGDSNHLRDAADMETAADRLNEGGHNESVKELLEYLRQQRESRIELAIAHSDCQERCSQEQSMAEKYERMYRAVTLFHPDLDSESEKDE